MPDTPEEAGSREQARGGGRGQSLPTPRPSLPHSLPETPTPTPGQIAYTAYCRALRLASPCPWDGIAPAGQAAWEAAAQAVREAHASLCPICNAELERCNTKESPHA